MCIGPNVVEVTSATPSVGEYFPELYLAQWLAAEGQPASVFCFGKSGVGPMRGDYAALVSELDAEALVLADGGVDILLRGDESSLGTPAEDVTSLAAAHAVGIPAFVVCLGFGTDARHGVSHAQVLRAIAELTAKGAFLGATALLPEMPEVRSFIGATRFALEKCGGRGSYVSSAILAASDGRFGPLPAPEESRDPPPWINPLLTLYWGFELHAVAQRCLYLDLISRTQTIGETTLFIRGFRKGVDRLDPEEIQI